jgi:hypothetical protein
MRMSLPGQMRTSMGWCDVGRTEGSFREPWKKTSPFLKVIEARPTIGLETVATTGGSIVKLDGDAVS